MKGRTLDDLRGLRFASWIRESTAGQYDRFGPESQQRSIAAFVERYGLVDSGITYTVAHSGRTVWRTTEMAALVADARARRFDALVVGYFDRWQRNLRRTLELVEDELHRNGVAWVMADRRLVSSDPNDWDEMVREAHEAERYSRKLADRVADGYGAKFARYADPGGNPPLGFRRSSEPPHLLEPDPATLETAVGLFRRYASGATSVRRLAAESSLPVHVVAETLRNPVYNGWVTRHGTQRRPATWRAAPPVPDHLWERVASIREREARFSGRLPNRPDLLRHLLRCPCGERVISNGHSHGYRQRLHPRTGCSAWPSRVVDGRPWERAIAAQIGSIRWDDATSARIVRALTADRPAPIDIARGAEVRRRRELANELADGRIGERDFIAAIAAVRAAAAERPAAADGLTAAEVATWLRDTAALWAHPATTDEDRADLAGAIYEEITVARSGIVKVRLTPDAQAHGLVMAMSERVRVDAVSPGGLGPTIATIPIEGRAAWFAASRRSA